MKRRTATAVFAALLAVGVVQRVARRARHRGGDGPPGEGRVHRRRSPGGYVKRSRTKAVPATGDFRPDLWAPCREGAIEEAHRRRSEGGSSPHPHPERWTGSDEVAARDWAKAGGSGSNGLAVAPPPEQLVPARAPPPTERRRFVGWKPLVTLVIVAIILASVALVQTHRGWSAAEAVGVAAPSESFTELFFTAPKRLGTATPDRHPDVIHDSVAFAIRNREHVARAYLWTIRLGAGSPVARGIANVPVGASTVIQRPIVISCIRRLGDGSRRIGRHVSTRRGASRVLVSVALTDPKESISHWAVCSG